VSCGSVLYTLDANVANVALPTIAHALGIARSTAVTIVSAYNLVLAMSLLPFAALGDRFGLRRVYVMGLALYLGAAAFCSVAGTLPLLLGARALQALAASLLLSVSLALVRAIYPERMLGRGMGLNTMAASAGAALAPVLGGAISESLSWHFVFAAGAPLALVGLCLAHSLPDPQPSGGAFDKAGAAYCAATFGLLIIGFQSLGEGLALPLAGGAFAAGLLFAFQLVRHELKQLAPVLPVDLLAQPKLSLSVAAALLAVLASTSLLLYVPFRLNALGFSAGTIGAMIAPYAGTVLIAAPASGMLSDKVSPQWLGIVGLSLATCGALTFAILPATPGYLDIAWRSALCGVGFSMFFSPNGRLMISSAPRDRVAGASSLLSTTRMFGQALGSVLLSGMLAMKLGAGAPASVAAALTLLGTICAAVRLRISHD